MGYELYLRRAGDRTVDEAAVEKRLADAGARLDRDRWVVELRHTVGDRTVASSGSVAFKPLRDEKGLSGFDLDVPFGTPEGELRAAFLVAAELGDTGPMTLFDPQLGKTLLKSAEDDLVASFRTVNKWQVDLAGVREDVRADAPVEPAKPLVDRRTRIFLYTVGAIVLLAWVASKVLSSLLTP